MKISISNKKDLSPKQREELVRALKDRFEKKLNRHKGLDWAKVQARLEAKPDKPWSLAEIQTHFLLTGAHCRLSMRAYEQSDSLITAHLPP